MTATQPPAESSPRGGIECRRCGCADLRVIQTWRGPKVIRRTRVCRHCGERMVTRETIAGAPPG